MIRIYPEQLAAQLREGLRACYLLTGNEPLLLQESQDLIRHAAQEQQFTEHYSISLDAHTDWDAIFSICQAMSLFASRQTLLLIFPENGPTAPIGEQLIKLAALLHDDILLMLRGPRLTKAPDAGTGAAPPLGRPTCQNPEAGTGRRGKPTAVLLLRRQPAGAVAGAGAAVVAAPGWQTHAAAR